jgi:hypothetical protein
MTFDQKSNEYTLSSGRTFYANCGYIGIGPGGSNDRLPEGYDGTIDLVRGWDEDFVPWTPEERAELADEMIRLWTAFKEAS